MKLKRLIATAGLAAVLAIGVGTGITMNRGMERADAVESSHKITANNVIALNNLKVGTSNDIYLSENVAYKTGDANLTLGVKGKIRTWTDGFRGYKSSTLSINLLDTTKVIQKVAISGGASSFTAAGYTFASKTFTPNSQDLRTIDIVISASASTQKFGDITVTYDVPAKGAKLTVTPGSSDLYVGETFTPANVLASGFTGTVTYNWTIDKPEIVNFASTSKATDMKPTFTVLAEGTAKATLTATDGTDTLTGSVTFTTHALPTLTSVTDAKAASNGTTVNVTGEVFDTGYKSYYICDADGTGIQLYNLDKRGYSFRVGDIISVAAGKRGAYNNSQQISNAEVIGVTPDAGDPVINATPKNITVDDMTAKNSNNYAKITDVVYKKFVKDPKGYGDNKMYFVGKNSSANDVEFYLNGISYKNPIVNTYIIGSKFSITGLSTHDKTSAFFEWGKTKLEIATTESGLTEKGQIWAATFLLNLKNECGQGGSSEYKLTKGTWDEQQTAYDALPQTDKDLFKAAVANAAGTAEEKVASLYDYCVNKYDFALSNNYIARAASTASNNAIIDNSNMIITIVAISAIAVSAIALLVIFKRRKATR